MHENTGLHPLRRFALFRELDDLELFKLQSIVIERAYRKKSVIFHEGSEAEAVYFIREGLIKAYKTDENGREHIVSFLKAGEMLPHAGLLGGAAYPATTEALTDTRLFAISVRTFEQLLLATPSIALKLLRVLSDKIRELQSSIQELKGQDVQHRCVSFLVKLAEQYGKERDGAIFIDLPMTNLEIASAIGTSRETVNRLLSQLRKEGILGPGHQPIVVQNLEALRAWTST